MGGEAEARLAAKLAMPTSPDALLRRFKAATEEPASSPQYVGVDEWAMAEGRDYGTILIDLERHCVIDILPGHDGEELQKWLKEHPGVEVVARDRWTSSPRRPRKRGRPGHAGGGPVALARTSARWSNACSLGTRTRFARRPRSQCPNQPQPSLLDDDAAARHWFLGAAQRVDRFPQGAERLGANANGQRGGS